MGLWLAMGLAIGIIGIIGIITFGVTLCLLCAVGGMVLCSILMLFYYALYRVVREGIEPYDDQNR